MFITQMTDLFKIKFKYVKFVLYRLIKKLLIY